MQMSYVIGEENFKNYQKIYGFGEKTGIDLPGEERGILNDKLWIFLRQISNKRHKILLFRPDDAD